MASEDVILGIWSVSGGAMGRVGDTVCSCSCVGNLSKTMILKVMGRGRTTLIRCPIQTRSGSIKMMCYVQ